MTDFHLVEANLRESFRALARGRERADVRELPGVSVASLGVSFQMFNAAFLSAPVEDEEQLASRLDVMRRYFLSRGIQWSFWVGEDWLARGAQRRLSRLCEQRRLRISAEMPGMVARQLAPASRKLPDLEYRRVNCERTLRDFRSIGALCFHVPPEWFGEVFDERLFGPRPGFASWVAYQNDVAVATAATVRAHGAIGLYNVATTPAHRSRGIAEALTRHVCAAQSPDEPLPFALQSTSQGMRMYERMGFRTVTRVLVYNSW